MRKEFIVDDVIFMQQSLKMMQEETYRKEATLLEEVGSIVKH